MAADLTPQEAKKIGVDAYIYGYSLITSDVTGTAFVAAPEPKTFQAPLNQFVSLPKYPPADYHGVTAPNADTLYSGAFIDVSKERIILSYPDMHGRYFLFPIYSMWTDVIGAPGKRTLGTGPQIIAITGPAWQGTLPQGITHQVKSPTGSGFIIGRVYAEATVEDYAAVNALQRDFKLVPLSSYGKPYTPPAGTIDPKAPSVKEIVRNVVSAMDTQTYFSMLARSMATNPPAAEDAPIVAEMAKIGIAPGQPSISASSPQTCKRRWLMSDRSLSPRSPNNKRRAAGWSTAGWSPPVPAHMARTIFGAPRPPPLAGARTCPRTLFTKADADGATLVGTNSYVVHLAKGETPPVDGFWSITMYDSEYYFYPNSLNKLTVSLRDHPTFNADGSLDLYFSHEKPANALEANWLPAPAGQFILMMRMYWPKERPPSILDGTWSPPLVKKVT